MAKTPDDHDHDADPITDHDHNNFWSQPIRCSENGFAHVTEQAGLEESSVEGQSL